MTQSAMEQFPRLEQSIGRLNDDLGGLTRSADLLAGRVPAWVGTALRAGLVLLVALVVFLIQWV
ncbi:MAG: hypothetical protein EAZ99_02775 [Alphaproteobacteria bacterium]|nr:hypothetical protein [Alphaproteobacteria bacterium]TAD91588.1 MAG: hypothetical protein EAZ99_02775 [Alphaproteobacteria bacterium]